MTPSDSASDVRRKAEELAYRRGLEETAVALFVLVDDCDRALKVLEDLDAAEAVRLGIEGMRLRLIQHFTRLGYEPFEALGEQFDPHRHEAISVEAGPGEEGLIVKVHRRGWLAGDKLAQAALVTVRQGGGQGQGPGRLPLERRRRRPQRRAS